MATQSKFKYTIAHSGTCQHDYIAHELTIELANVTYYWEQRGHIPFLNTSGFSSIAALARRTCSSFCSLPSLRWAASLLSTSSFRSFFCYLHLASLLPQLPLRIPLLDHLQIFLVLLLDLSVHPRLKVTERGSGLQNIQLLHIKHTWFYMTLEILNKKYKLSPST